MWKLGLTLVGFMLVACAEVPYDNKGRVIVPPTANFASPAREGVIDDALEELIIRIDPGAEEVRSIALFSIAAIVACELNNCQRNRGSGARRTRNVAISVDATKNASAATSRIEAFQRTDIQIQELTDLAEAIAVIAERDSLALAIAGSVENAESWVALYEKRQQTLTAAQLAVLNHRKQLVAFSSNLQKSSAGRTLERRSIALLQSTNRKLAEMNENVRKLDLAIAKMRDASSFSRYSRR